MSRVDEILRLWRQRDWIEPAVSLTCLPLGLWAAWHTEDGLYAFGTLLLIAVGIPAFTSKVLREREDRAVRRLTARP